MLKILITRMFDDNLLITFDISTLVFILYAAISCLEECNQYFNEFIFSSIAHASGFLLLTLTRPLKMHFVTPTKLIASN